MIETFTATGKIWIWQAEKGSWHFVNIESDVAAEIKLAALMLHGKRRGFGSIKVTATINETSWQTSIFPSKKIDGWILPIKAAVRKAENLVEGDEITLSLVI
ncbi:hypothetical protein LPB140_03035 [Sphingorhabdus lutea]|uniref:DUF1905 domain-containing protein n=1 Tax=Sphingorhabdus lutea TaxID=1913578 RepID=A0A1L3JA27_9SPHN|nr:DUF1905 domain-containing protein [Sphingorhabdus lutea]APG61969.1 hypothetical protein LPB140_03035 [Sphingorhabdus lutea]